MLERVIQRLGTIISITNNIQSTRVLWCKSELIGYSCNVPRYQLGCELLRLRSEGSVVNFVFTRQVKKYALPSPLNGWMCMICWIVQFLKECSCLKPIRGIPALNQEGLFLIPMNVGRVDREGQRIECLSPISRLPNLQDELAQATQNFSKRFGRSQFLVARTVPGCLREIKNRQKFRGVQNFAKF